MHTQGIHHQIWTMPGGPLRKPCLHGAWPAKSPTSSSRGSGLLWCSSRCWLYSPWKTPGHSGRMERAVAKAFMMEFHHLRYRYQRYSSQHLRTCRGSVMEQTMDWILFTHKNVDIFTRTNPKSETYRLNICNNILHWVGISSIHSQKHRKELISGFIPKLVVFLALLTVFFCTFVVFCTFLTAFPRTRRKPVVNRRKPIHNRKTQGFCKKPGFSNP